MLLTIRGHRLTHFLESFLKTIKIPMSSRWGNWKYQHKVLWLEQQDQLLVFGVLSSMTEGILTRILGCESALIWMKLNLYFVGQTRAKTSQFKIMLQNIKKGSLTKNEYLLKVMVAVVKLASVGHTLLDPHHVEATFYRMPEEYDTFVIYVNSRPKSYSFGDLNLYSLHKKQG